MMIMQEVRKKRSVYDGSGVHGGVALSCHEARLGHARALLHETESRLATTFDTAQVAAPEARVEACAETCLEVAQPIRAVQGECDVASADVPVSIHLRRAGASMRRLLRCLELGGVHEICSLALHASWSGTSHKTANARQDGRAMLCEHHGPQPCHSAFDARAAVLGSATTDTVSAPHTVAPYAVLMFLAQWIASRHDGSDKSGVPCHVAWIGDRVHPDADAFRAIPRLKHAAHHEWRGADGQDGSDGGSGELGRQGEDGKRDLASRSFFVRDSDRAFTPVRHGHLARSARARRTNAARLEMDARACNRLWCTEQAIRMGAAGVLIVDGNGFSPLAWRRLQLAVDAVDAVDAGSGAARDEADGSADKVMEAGAKPMSLAREGLHRKPCVLVVVPSDRRGQSAGCAATARWSVHAAVPDCVHQVDASGKNFAAANPRGVVGFAWRLEMVSARRFGLQALAHGGEDSHGGGGIEVVMSRSTEGAHAEQSWSRVAERAAQRRLARAIPHVLQAPLAAGTRGTNDPDNTVGRGAIATFAARAESAVETEDVLGGVRAWRARSA